MRGVLTDRHGRRRRRSRASAPGARPGTTSNYTDAWFVGSTPQGRHGAVDDRRGLGRLRERRQVDGEGLRRQAGLRRHLPGADLARLHRRGDARRLLRTPARPRITSPTPPLDADRQRTTAVATAATASTDAPTPPDADHGASDRRRRPTARRPPPTGTTTATRRRRGTVDRRRTARTDDDAGTTTQPPPPTSTPPARARRWRRRPRPTGGGAAGARARSAPRDEAAAGAR